MGTFLTRVGKNFCFNPFLVLSRFFLAVFLMIFPWQVRTLLYAGGGTSGTEGVLGFNRFDGWNFVGGNFFLSGNFNPFTSFFLHASDFALILAFLFFVLAFVRKEIATFSFGDTTFFRLLLVLLVWIATGYFWASDPILHGFIIMRFLEMFFLYLLLVNGVLRFHFLLLYLVAGMSFQALLSVGQYIFQSSLGFNFLGEPVATAQTLGVAKIDFAGYKLLRSFGTFPHANVLGGSMVLAFFTFLLGFPRFHSQKNKRYWGIALIGLFCLALLLSFSRSAFLALFIALAVMVTLKKSTFPWTKIMIATGLFIVFISLTQAPKIMLSRFLNGDINAFSERALYLEVSIKMFMEHPFGVGLGSFTSVMQDFTPLKLTPWLYQPVHNIFLLAFNEMGIVGGVLFAGLFVSLFYRTLKGFGHAVTAQKKDHIAVLFAMLLVIVIIGLFDHYFFTLYAGQVWVFLVFGLVESVLASEKSRV